MFATLLAILTGATCVGVATVELLERGAAAHVTDQPGQHVPPGPGTGSLGALLAVLALLAVAGWALGPLAPPAWMRLAMSAALLIAGLQRLTGTILRASGTGVGADRDRDLPGTAPSLLPAWWSIVGLVVAAGVAGGFPVPAAVGALAGTLAATAGGPIRARLARLTTSLAVLAALVLATMSTLWAGDSVGIAWPGNGVTVLALFLGYLVVAAGGMEISRQWRAAGARLPDARTEGS